MLLLLTWKQTKKTFIESWHLSDPKHTFWDLQKKKKQNKTETKKKQNPFQNIYKKCH